MLKKASEQPELARTEAGRQLASDMASVCPVMQRGRITGIVAFVSLEQARAELGCEPTGEWQVAGRYEYKLAPQATLQAAAEELSR